jgi:hypothetical protein
VKNNASTIRKYKNKKSWCRLRILQYSNTLWGKYDWNIQNMLTNMLNMSSFSNCGVGDSNSQAAH